MTADEGMWVPPAIGTRLPMSTLKKMGFELSREQLWSEGEGSLRSAFLQVGSLAGDGSLNPYGSASFVSSKGLIVTNHHVAFDAIAGLSKPEENLIEDGFRAETMADERHCQGLGMRITTLYENVTEQVISAVKPEMTSAERAEAVAEKSAALITEATEKGFEDVDVVEMLHGLAYYRVAYKTFRDIRLVYAPPRMIGEYGGDTDNWMWPRHTGDFTFFRAYVGEDGNRDGHSESNVPYSPDRFLEVSLDGVQEGDFTFIMGYPGSTNRHDSSYAVEFWEKIELPQQLDGLTRYAENIEEQRQGRPRGEDCRGFRPQVDLQHDQELPGKDRGPSPSRTWSKRSALARTSSRSGSRPMRRACRSTASLRRAPGSLRRAHEVGPSRGLHARRSDEPLPSAAARAHGRQAPRAGRQQRRRSAHGRPHLGRAREAAR